MNTVEDDASAASPTNAVSKFGAAYATTQESLCNRNASINSIQGQIQMLCNAIGNQPPAGMLQYPQQNNQKHQAHGSQRGQHQKQGQQGQPGGGSGGTNNGVKKNVLYRGNSNGSGYNQGSGMAFNGGSGRYPSQGTSTPPSPLKHFNN
jgi:hypothetical protein